MLAAMITEADIRRVALALPETSEKLSWGTPFFRVRNRGFARIREEGDVLAVYCADESEKQALIASEPDKFFTTPTTTATPWSWSASPPSTSPNSPNSSPTPGASAPPAAW